MKLLDATAQFMFVVYLRMDMVKVIRILDASNHAKSRDLSIAAPEFKRQHMRNSSVFFIKIYMPTAHTHTSKLNFQFLWFSGGEIMRKSHCLRRRIMLL